MLLSDPECNFLLQMEALHIDAFRSLLINIILKMDMCPGIRGRCISRKFELSQ